MKKYILGFAALAVAIAAFFAGAASGVVPFEPEIVTLDTETPTGDKGDSENPAGNESAIDQSIRDFLARHPEVVIEAQQKYAQIEADKEAAGAKAALAENRQNIISGPSLPVIGNPDGKITLVEFFDYNCGYCRKAHEDMLQVQKNNAAVKIVLQPFPILGPDSTSAHSVAAAFHVLYPAQYGAFHNSVLSAEEKADEESTMAIAKSLGADEAALRAEMAKPSINEGFNRTYALASALKITGTPTYVIGDQIVSGAVGFAALNEAIESISGTN